jgi:MFS family permease
VTAQHAKRNLLLHTLDGIFFMAGITLFNMEAVVPKLIGEFSDSALLVGLVPMVMWLGQVLPQPIAAKTLEGLAYKKRAILLIGTSQRLGWMLLLASLLLHWSSPFTLVSLFIAIGINSISNGVVVPIWTDFYAKTVTRSMWARVMGLRQASSGVIGIALGLFIDAVFARFPAPARYQILAGLTLLFLGLSYVAFALVHEEPEPGLPNQRTTTWTDYFLGLARCLSRRQDFRWFAAASLLCGLPLTVTLSFLAKYGLASPAAQEGVTGAFTASFKGAAAVGALTAGLLSDRRSPLAPFRIAPLLFVAGALAAASSNAPQVVCAAFALVGASLGMVFASTLPALFRYAEHGRIPTYAAAYAVLLSIPRAVAPPVVGCAVDSGLIGFPAVFAGCAAMCFVGWLAFLRAKPPLTEDGADLPPPARPPMR